MQGGRVFRGVQLVWGDKEVTMQNLVAKVMMEVLGRLLGDMMVPLLELNRFEILLGELEESQSASLTQRMRSNIPTVFSWGSSIGLEGFLPSIMLLVVIIVVVTVILVVVVVEGQCLDESFHEFLGVWHHGGT
ncbi:hypothetical protein Tco_1509814 [Tanacetum coccineum]